MGRRVQHERPVDWHVFNRGSRRMALFRDQADADTFLSLLQAGAALSGSVLWAYVLMTNHFHLALRGTSQQLTRYMHFLEGMYATYHNKRYGLSGAAFEGRYEAYPQGTLPMLFRTVAYIFTNPVAAGITPTPGDYSWSSYSSIFCEDNAGLAKNADLLLRRMNPDPWVARERMRIFIGRELDRIERKEHRPGLSAKDVQANHFDWLLEQARATAPIIGQCEAMTLAVYWAQKAGFHRSALRLALGGRMSSTLRGNLTRFRRWLETSPAQAALASLP